MDELGKEISLILPVVFDFVLIFLQKGNKKVLILLDDGDSHGFPQKDIHEMI